MPDEPNPPRADREPGTPPSRRSFLKAAGTVAASAVAASAVATVGCAPGGSGETSSGAEGASAARVTGFDRPTLDALGDVVLPASLGAEGRAAAVSAFVAWIDGYEPVAEEMHGYGYSDIRYLPADPAPGWRAQLAALDVLARKTKGKALAECDAAARLEVVTAALAPYGSARLPEPLGAPHVALALLSHWTNSPGAWDLALGVRVGRNTCRQLDGVERKPLPVVGAAQGGAA